MNPDRPVRVVFALGSNLGNRRYELELAIDMLKRHCRLLRRSRIIETDPVDSPSGAGRFLNMVIVGLTLTSPSDLLVAIHDHERSRGRRRIERNEPRRIDIDIIRYGALRLRTPELVIPHPRFHERDFVTGPMSELSLPSDHTGPK